MLAAVRIICEFQRVLGPPCAAGYVVEFLEKPLKEAFEEVQFFDCRLAKNTALLANGYDAVCLFVNDDCSAEVVEILAAGGVKTVAMRCAGSCWYS